jgi:hypothetical protein
VAEFTVEADTPLPAAAAWGRLTDWPRHGRYVPLTRMRVTSPGANRVGTVFVARTSLGPIGVDDPMEIVEWRPPTDGAGGFCRIEKRGRVVLGWAELSVGSRPDGSHAIWREEATPARSPRFVQPLLGLAGRWLFSRVLRRLLTD